MKKIMFYVYSLTKDGHLNEPITYEFESYRVANKYYSECGNVAIVDNFGKVYAWKYSRKFAEELENLTY